MQVLDNIGYAFGELWRYAQSARDYCHSVPVLGGSLAGFFESAAGLFWDIRTGFYSASAEWDHITARLLDILSWDSIRGLIDSTWSMSYDLWGDIATGARNVILTDFPFVADFWVNVAQGVRDTIAAEYSFLADFSGNVAGVVGSWLDENIESWVDDNAERAANMAGKVLDKIWD